MLGKEFKNKRVLILGLGLHGGGAGAASFFARAGAKVVVTDIKTKKDLRSSLEKLKAFKNISYVLGKHRERDIVNADLIIKNPGIPEDSPWLRLASAHGVTILSDLEVFFKYSPAEIIGITGTKGKSTTAYLIAEFLKEGGRKNRGRIVLAGNIRKSVLDPLMSMRKDDTAVLELSSFQLDALVKSRMSPHIAVLTNIFPDHLNRYRGFADYVRSKTGIFRFQKKGDYLFVNGSDKFVKKISRRARSKRIAVDIRKTIAPWQNVVGLRYLAHQEPSVALAIAVSRHRGISSRTISAVLKRAKPLPGRLEIVGNIRSITFINDTTATNPGAAAAALSSLYKKSRGIVLIAGGAAKNLPAEDFVRSIANFARAVVFLPGSATQDFARKLKPLVKNKKGFVAFARTMGEAVTKASSMAKRGDIVLLSPGAASFGLFHHEFDRGDQFVKAVKNQAKNKKA